MSDRIKKLISLPLFLLLIIFVIDAQEETAREDTPAEEVLDGDTSQEERVPGEFSFFLDNRLIIALSAPDVGFGFGGTVNFQYIFPFNLGVGLETGYYSFRSEIYNEEGGDNVLAVGGYSLLPVYATVSYNIRIVENLFYITPVLKGGGAYARARINGWLGGESFAFLFEGGVRFKAYIREDFLIHAGITYTGMVEASGLFSILTIGMGMGL